MTIFYLVVDVDPAAFDIVKGIFRTEIEALIFAIELIKEESNLNLFFKFYIV